MSRCIAKITHLDLLKRYTIQNGGSTTKHSSFFRTYHPIDITSIITIAEEAERLHQTGETELPLQCYPFCIVIRQRPKKATRNEKKTM